MGTSNRERSLLYLALLTAAAVIFWWLSKPTPPAEDAPAVQTAPVSVPGDARSMPSAEPPVAPAPSAVPSAAPMSEPAAESAPAGEEAPPQARSAPPQGQTAGAAAPEIRTVLEEVGTTIRDFRNAIGENPVGTNAEITKALLGDNLRQVKLPLPPGTQVNGEGEMIDQWGTPLFFHQLSGTQMEIRSAGPDRQMWTVDDVQSR